MIKHQLADSNHPLQQLISQYEATVVENLICKKPIIEKMLRAEKCQSSKLFECSSRIKDLHNERMTKMNVNSKAFNAFSQSLLRNTFNNQRFGELTPEVIFAEVLFLEVQQFMGMIYGALVRFYLPVVPMNILDLMKEDFLEMITSAIVSGYLADLLF